VDRLRRNDTDVVDAIHGFMRRGVIIKTVINGMTFDGSTADPMQQAVDALIAFTAATAHARAEATNPPKRLVSPTRARRSLPRTSAANRLVIHTPATRPHSVCSVETTRRI
jgi:hypothetical protein